MTQVTKFVRRCLGFWKNLYIADITQRIPQVPVIAQRFNIIQFWHLLFKPRCIGLLSEELYHSSLPLPFDLLFVKFFQEAIGYAMLLFCSVMVRMTFS